MVIVQRGGKASRAGLVGLFACLALIESATRIFAADQAPQPAALIQEMDRPDQFMVLNFNRLGTVWSELNRTRLFKQFGADANMQATAAKLYATFDARLKKLEALKPGTPAGYTVEQLGKVGPLGCAFHFNPETDGEFTLLRIAHGCDQNFLRMFVSMAIDDDARFIEQLVTRENPDFHLHDSAYRVRNGWTLLQSEYGARQLISADRLVLSGGTLTEDQLLAPPPAAIRPSRADFVQYLAAEPGPWLSGILVDFNYLADISAKNHQRYGPKNPDLFGAKGFQLLRAREAVNAGGRFEAVGECTGVDLHKHFALLGANQPIAGALGKAVSEDAALALYANLDFGQIMAAGPEQFAGHSAEYAEFAKELQSELKWLVDGSSRWEPAKTGAEKIEGPTLGQGFLWTLYDPDRLQEIENAYTIAFGVKPGFKPTEKWARAVLHCPEGNKDNGGMGDEEGNANNFKTVEYGGVTIYVGHRWRDECLAITDSALILGEDLKYMKKMIKALQNVEAQQLEKNNFAEWAALQALAQKEGGNLCGYGVARTPSLLNKYGRMAVGGLAMVMPGLATDMDWAKMTAGMEPALGVLTYTPEKGFKAHTVADLPVASSLIGAAIVGLSAQQLYEGRWYGRHEENNEDDLPPVAMHSREGAMMTPPMPVPAPVEEKVEEAQPAEAAPAGE